MITASDPAALFDALDPVTPGFLLGTWAGGLFDETGRMAARLVEMGWYGKRFHDTENVDPLLCRSADGGVYAYDGMGAARVREIAYRGKVSAAMVYDTQPIIDHFRRYSGDVVLGAMDAKGQPGTLYFHLTRV
ncbi:DUF4334 domain-containing protein [Actinomadura macrotermitis]|uniref:DUF4334 domain-containing protein n=1 Tax=Actinomadura macrotermitis TaxID=2585200 RepID=A0A7K0BWZ7_9ACTN|nr:DUF4334 domain-containing protein [Actinomadura macrotermitis]MQY05703.1 hypothetical protein [Actinomadura macrotermitis]